MHPQSAPTKRNDTSVDTAELMVYVPNSTGTLRFLQPGIQQAKKEDMTIGRNKKHAEVIANVT